METQSLLFVFAFNMGVKGAAIATVIGQALTFVMSVTYLFRAKNFKINKKISSSGSFSSFKNHLNRYDFPHRSAFNRGNFPSSIIMAVTSHNIVTMLWASLINNVISFVFAVIFIKGRK
ncbi:MAG: hypothetical protein MR852_12415 [Treponema sp.]|nr:hypothetical protein [Treponema sp.]